MKGGTEKNSRNFGSFCTDGTHAGTNGGGVSIGDNAEEQDKERE